MSAGIIGRAYRENDNFVSYRVNDDYEKYVQELVEEWEHLRPPGQRAGERQRWRAYSREEIPPLFGLEFSTAIWNVGFVKRPGHICLLVTLDKAGHGEDFQYTDHFSRPAEFEWQSQNRTGQSSADGQQPVVKRQRRTEVGEAPRGQGATTENTGSI